jgi:hypothetical protein
MKFIKTTFESFIITISEKINEGSFYDFPEEELLSDKSMKKFIDGDQDYVENVLSFYMQENELEDEDEDEITETEDFIEFLRSELKQNLDNVSDSISGKIDNITHKITLYRVMTVDSNWIAHLKNQGKRLGIYWSWDADAAEAHWGDHNKKAVKIEIDIDEKYVNWKETLELNIHPNYMDEKEIRLYKNTQIKIKSILLDNTKIDISILGDKIFFA